MGSVTMSPASGRQKCANQKSHTVRDIGQNLKHPYLCTKSPVRAEKSLDVTLESQSNVDIPAMWAINGEVNGRFEEKSGELKPSVCGKCNKAFPQNDDYLQHLIHQTECIKTEKGEQDGQFIHISGLGHVTITMQNTMQDVAYIKTEKEEQIFGLGPVQGADNDIEEEPYPCDLCTEVFSSKAQFKNHMLSHSVEKQHKSAACGEGSETESVLEEHSVSPVGKKENTCHKYHSVSASKQQPSGHVVNDRKEDEYVLLYICSECHASFTQKEDLARHNVKHKKNQKKLKRSHKSKLSKKKKAKSKVEKSSQISRQRGKKRHVCDVCEKAFSTASNLQRHALQHTRSQVKKYLCKDCGKCFKQMEHLNSHMLLHSEGKQYQCTKCDKCFRLKSNLTKHIFTHSDTKRHSCGYCDKAFRSRKGLMAHVLTHTGKSDYQCTLCKKYFICNSRLKRHMLAHNSTKAHRCTQCDKAYARPEHLKRHLATHSSVKPHKCTQCEKSFALQQYLDEHMHIHGEGNKYECAECGKLCNQKSALRSHMTTHTGEKPYKCTICDKGFAQSTSLKYHTMAHMGEKPHQCKVCNKSFTIKASLKIHVKTHLKKCSKRKACKDLCETSESDASEN